MEKDILIPIYNATVRFIIQDSIDQAMSKYTDDVGENEDAMTVWFDSQHLYVIGIKDDSCRPTTIAHEVSHVTHRIMNAVGLDHSLLGDEAECYLAGYINGEITEIVRDYFDDKLNELRFMKNFAL